MHPLLRRTPLIAAVLALAANGCDAAPSHPAEPEITQERAREIWNSAESRRVVELQTRFVEYVDAALNRGISLEEIRAAATVAVDQNDDSRLADLLFDNRGAAADYAAELAAARLAVQTRFPELAAVRRQIDGSACTLTGDRVNAFFSNFDAIRTSRLAPPVAGVAMVEEEGPVCGSYGNQLKLVVCAGACGVATAGVGAGLCGWACWCSFCSEESAVADIICASSAE